MNTSLLILCSALILTGCQSRRVGDLVSATRNTFGQKIVGEPTCQLDSMTGGYCTFTNSTVTLATVDQSFVGLSPAKPDRDGLFRRITHSDRYPQNCLGVRTLVSESHYDQKTRSVFYSLQPDVTGYDGLMVGNYDSATPGGNHQLYLRVLFLNKSTGETCVEWTYPQPC